MCLTQAIIAGIVAIPGLRFLTDSLRQREAPREFTRTVPLDALTVGRPTMISIRAPLTDAYVRYPPGPVGTVWLLREESPGAASAVRCWQSICPHLGCGIDYAVDRKAFFCPCHASEFGLDGSTRSGPSPRSMDELAVRITEPDADGKRWVEVQYEEFRTGVEERRRIT